MLINGMKQWRSEKKIPGWAAKSGGAGFYFFGRQFVGGQFV